MKYKNLGKRGLSVSSLCMGTMTFGNEADEKTSAEMYHACREQGINCFDSANMYAQGLSEKILGKLVKPERDKVIITSKAYFKMGDDINSKGLSRRHLFHSVEESLKRLDTDYIDIFYFHRFDEGTALEESLRAMHDLISQGKILYLGASNFSAWQIMKGCGISQAKNLHTFSCIQPMYNLLKRQAEVEIFPMAQEENLGVFSFSPLGGGMLTGKYLSPSSGEEGRFFKNQRYQMRYSKSQYHECTEKFLHFAQERGYNPSALAIAWAASHPAVTAPIIGARSVEQLQAAFHSLDIPMTSTLREEISALSFAPAHPTDRNEEVESKNFREA